MALPAQALELSANAAANERNAASQPLWAGTAVPPLLANLPEGASPSQAAPALSADAAPVAEAVEAQEQGGASWYARHFQGRRTANGERYDQNELTAAHKTLPFGTVVRVRSEVNGKEVDVRINDRGPFVAGRVIDLSQAAAKALGMLQLGVKKVTLLLPSALRPGNTNTNATTVEANPPKNEPYAQPSARALTPSIR
jgi:rare lipoprotein A